jgi:voltage-gated potassium channel
MGRLRTFFATPLLRRMSWHVKRVADKLDRRFFTSVLLILLLILGVSALAVWAAETDRTLGEFGASFYWAVTTVLGQGDASYVSGPVGWAVSWLLGLFGVTIVATITGALVGFVIDFLIKEGQGMGASGYENHIVVCGWNSTARDLIKELSSDDYRAQVVLLCDMERNPAGDLVYFVKGDPSNEGDLKRAGIEHAMSAIVCPADGSKEADMASILTILAIESIQPKVRTVVEVNNPEHVPHFRRANVDEVMVTSKLAAHLLARSALYPGLSELVSDIVSGGEGSELYRVQLPDDCVGKPVDDVSAMLRRNHGATLLGVSRNGQLTTNPAVDFVFELEDNLIVIAESLGVLSPLENATALTD